MFKPQTCLALLLLSLIYILPTHSTLPRTLQSVSVTNRTSTLYKRCPIPRADFIKSQTNQSQSWARQQIAKYISFNGDAIIYDLTTNNTSALSTQINAAIPGIVVFFVFMIIGLIILIIFGPIMMCCCCKPKNCPCSSCCRGRVDQSSYQQYTPCQRKWPGCVIFFVAIIAGAGALAVIGVDPQLQTGFSDTRCSTSILMDDLINGNYTQDMKQYWIGLQPLQASFNGTGLLATLQTPQDQLLDQIKVAQQQVADISTGPLSYVSPLNLSPSQITSSTPTTSSTLPSMVSQLQQSLQALLTQAQALVAPSSSSSSSSSQKIQLGSALPLSQSITPPNTSSPLYQYASQTQYAQNLDKDFDNRLSEVQDKIITPVSIAIYVIFGLIAGLSLLLLIATLCVCCNRHSMRKSVYACCGMLVLLGILSFLISIFMSFLTVGIHYGCNYVDRALDNRTIFVYRFQPIFDNQVLTEFMAQCAVRPSNGVVVASSSSPLQSSQTSLSTTLSNLLVTSNNLTSTLNKYLNSEVLDIESDQDLLVLKKIADAQQYGCSGLGLLGDSWVPSINQDPVYVQCRSGVTSKADDKTCPNIAGFTARRPGCVGCIDTPKVLRMFTNYTEVLGALNLRYPSSDCQVFNQQLTNTWQNFYYKKSQQISPIVSKSESLAQSIQTMINLSTQMSSSSSSSSSPSSTSPPLLGSTTSSPILVGATPPTSLSCKVLGQDIELLLNTFCSRVFKFSFATWAISLGVSFCIVLMMFCSTCLGMRAYHSEKREKYLENHQQDKYFNGNPPSGQEMNTM